MDRLDDDDDSLDPSFDGGLWERQSGALTVAELRRALEGLAPELPVECERYDGQGSIEKIMPMHIDLRGFDGRPDAVVIFGQ